jgi:hypothetical protein
VPRMKGTQTSSRHQLPASHTVSEDPQDVGSEPIAMVKHAPWMQRDPGPHASLPQMVGLAEMSMDEHSPLLHHCPGLQASDLEPHFFGSDPRAMGRHSPATQISAASQALPDFPQLLGSSPMVVLVQLPQVQMLGRGHASTKTTCVDRGSLAGLL